MPPHQDKTDVDTGFFAAGRDFESINTNHKFTDEEKELMAKFESMEYLPCNSAVYRAHQREENPHHKNYDRWILVFFIGLCTGLVSFLLRECLQKIAEAKEERLEELVDNKKYALAWAWYTCYGLIFAATSSILIAFVHPPATGSGVPDVIGYLNGVHVHKILNVKTLVIKFISCACAVGSGLPVGPEGPMIHMGAMIGAGLSQGRSKTLKFSTNLCQRFRNSKDRRDFTVAGAAAGVAAAFGAPVGGVLFAMEEVASYWDPQLSWLIFFGTMTSVATGDVLASVLTAFKPTGLTFGQFSDDSSVLFGVTVSKR